MTDSMKFGPEWLRNLSNDMSTGGGGGATSTTSTAPLGPRHQLAEYRYGREEMLSLFDKNLKLPEILPTFKKLFVDKIQCPLALIPSTEVEDVNSAQRPWVMRSPVSLGIQIRGASRGGSVDRGRGRSRGTYHMSHPFPRPTPVYDEDLRVLGKQTERGWPERNGSNEVGAGDWNGSPSSSPRKEYNSHGRGSNLENWRRARIEDDAGDGWRGVNSNSISAGNTYRSSRSTSWRDEDSSASTNRSISWRDDDNPGTAARSSNWGEDENSTTVGPGGDGSVPPIMRSLSTSATLGNSSTNSVLDRNGPPSTSKSSNYKNNSVHTNSNESVIPKSNLQWDTDDSLPEWAMENPTDGGGSFDASGAFHGPNDRSDEDHQRQTNRNESNKIEKFAKTKDETLNKKIEKTASDHVARVQCESNGAGERVKAKDPPKEERKKSPDSLESVTTISETIEELKDLVPGKDQSVLPLSMQHAVSNLSKISSTSELPDRMQEVDDMVEKLIMDDELSTTATKHNSKTNSSATTSTVPILRNSSVTSSSPTAALLQQPLVTNHPMIQQTQGNICPDPWYYRDPQGQVQGPFTAAEMAEWYRAGYFDENLFVRRVCDSRYVPLGELVKICGNGMPFPSSHLIPPLEPELPNQPPVTHMNAAQSNSQATMISPKPGASILPQNDMLTLNIHLQMLQKEYLLRQQNIILSKLAQSEHWPLVSPERQQQMLNQQMSQVVLPDHIMNLTAYTNSLAALNPSFALQQMIASAKDLNQPKPPQAPASHAGLNQFMAGPTDFNATSGLHSLMQNPGSTQQPPPPPQSQHHAGPMGDNDPLKTLLRQLHMQKGMQLPATQMPQALPNKWPPNIMPQQQQQPQQPWPTSSTAPNTAPVSMWDFGTLPSNKPEMRTEQQILEEQMQNEKQTETVIEPEKELLPAPIQVASQPKPTPPSQQMQPSQNKKEEKVKTVVEEKPAKAQKHDDDSKRGNKNKQDKKDNAQSKKAQSTVEDDRKKEAEERKKQKEEKKRAQLEEEKKRLQAQEDEKRRQIIEEKKRQEEIDQHRRAKMLENAPPKSTKQASYESGNVITTSSGRITSSIAPWSNTGLPGITSPGPSLAEIQKAERERRAEEQRLEQILEHQRKSQQMEIQVQKENAIKWNAPSRKPINVKSLTEIQAEEHKRQLASEQAASAAAAAHIDQSRRKDDSNQTTGYGNNAFGSIWSTRSPAVNTTWKAWNATSSAGFWEEPTKIPITNSNKTSAASNNNNGGPSPRMLSKSQTISNIQSVKHINLQQQQGGIGKQNPVNANGQQGNGNNNTKQQKGAVNKTSTKNGASGGGGTGAISNSANGAGASGKKDDARNEFTSWCIKAMALIKSSVDVPTFIAFLQDIESPFEVKDYIRLYLGESKECSEFAKQFLERRSKYKNQQRVNAHIDDMCSPAPAINPSSNDFQEVKGKGKKEKKKNKMTKLDGRILGFSVTAAQDRINVGDRDYGDAS